MSVNAKLNKFIQENNVYIAVLSEKQTQKGSISQTDPDNMIAYVGLQISEAKNNKYIIRYYLSVKNPKDKYIPRISKQIICNKVKNNKPDGVVIVSKSDLSGNSLVFKASAMALNDALLKIQHGKLDMFVGSSRTNKTLYRLGRLLLGAFHQYKQIINALEENENAEKETKKQ